MFHLFPLSSFRIIFLRFGFIVADIPALREIAAADEPVSVTALALEQFKAERKRFLSELSKIDFIEVIPTQANYFMIKIKDKYNAQELTNIFADRYGILIKDLTAKVGDKYIRIAIRNKEDNDRLCAALKELQQLS